MMDITQKIADLIAKAKRSMWGKSGLSSDLARNTYIAEYLISHGVTVLEEPIKIVIPEGVDKNALIEMLHNAPLQIFPGEPVQTDPQTNADRIRAMSDRELAHFMAERNVNESTLLLLNEGHSLTATQIKELKHRIYCACMQWLRQPAEEAQK